MPPIVRNTILLFLLISGISFAQPQTNLELVHSLIDSSVAKIFNSHEMNGEKYFIDFNSAPEYNYLKNRVISASAKYVSLTDNKESGSASVTYSLDNVSVKYLDPYKDGLFGDFYMQRTVSISGSYVTFGQKSYADKFVYQSTDTIGFDNARQFETATLPFTRAELPEEPFFASLLEPAIAVASVAITIILFFTVRSN